MNTCLYCSHWFNKQLKSIEDIELLEKIGIYDTMLMTGFCEAHKATLDYNEAVCELFE